MNGMSALTLTLPDGSALALRRPADAMRLEPANQTPLAPPRAGRWPGDAGAAGARRLLSTLSVADNLALAASYHGMPWAELDAALACCCRRWR